MIGVQVVLYKLVKVDMVRIVLGSQPELMGGKSRKNIKCYAKENTADRSLIDLVATPADP